MVRALASLQCDPGLIPRPDAICGLSSASARPRHYGNPALHSEKGPQKNEERANLALYFYKASCRLKPGIVF